ncbi:DEAD/DEAH box helicase, partial [Candidatus Parvarchaeota archaeon]|nr:DEAD/DEAH box helicase [Candidatus Parvarchaeota archaeon]
MEKQQESIGTGQQQAHAQFPILKNKSLVPRQYQVEICRSIIEKGSTLVVLPTGLGKTLIAFLAMGHFLQEGKCVFLAPTKPLVQQHYRRILEDLDVGGEDVALVSGEIKPEQRADLWKRKIAVCTPQTLKNDVEAGRAVFDYAFCVFDEAHRTTGLYAYTHLAKLAVQQGTVVLAMTASPGSNMKKIAPLVEALGIKNVQIRTDEDESVAKYVQKVQINYVPVELDSRLWQIRQSLEKIIQQHFDTLCSMGFVGKFKSKKGLLELRDRIIRSTSHMRYSALSYFTTLFNLVHAQELFETQGVATFLSYIEKLKSRQQTKGIERILKDSRIKAIVQSLETGGEHPKLAKLVELLENVRGQKTIVFVQYRAQISTIVAKLCSLGFKAQRFVGKKEGVTQAIQRQTMEKFRSGEFDILVASSIGE